MKTPNIVIADLDGTIALIEHRRHWLDVERHPELTSDERWRRFYAECVNDLPNTPVINTLQALDEAYYEIHKFRQRGLPDSIRQGNLASCGALRVARSSLGSPLSWVIFAPAENILRKTQLDA